MSWPEMKTGAIRRHKRLEEAVDRVLDESVDFMSARGHVTLNDFIAKSFWKEWFAPEGIPPAEKLDIISQTSVLSKFRRALARAEDVVRKQGSPWKNLSRSDLIDILKRLQRVFTSKEVRVF